MRGPLYFSVIFLVLLAFALASCGGARRSAKNAHQVPRGVPEQLLYAQRGVDSQGRQTGWPDLTPMGLKRELESESGSESQADDSTAGVDYFFQLEGRIRSGKFVADRTAITPATQNALITFPCRGGVPGAGLESAFVPQGAPLELGFWISLLSFFKGLPELEPNSVNDSSIGVLVSKIMDINKNESDNSIQTLQSATREIIEFRPAPGVECAAQLKVYKLSQSLMSNPAMEAQEDLRRRGAIRGELMAQLRNANQDTSAVGQLSMELVRNPDKGLYELRIHVGLDVDALIGDGETMDKVLRCVSDRPLLAGTIPGYADSCEFVADGGWRVAVSPVR